MDVTGHWDIGRWCPHTESDVNKINNLQEIFMLVTYILRLFT